MYSHDKTYVFACVFLDTIFCGMVVAWGLGTAQVVSGPATADLVVCDVFLLLRHDLYVWLQIERVVAQRVMLPVIFDEVTLFRRAGIRKMDSGRLTSVCGDTKNERRPRQGLRVVVKCLMRQDFMRRKKDTEKKKRQGNATDKNGYPGRCCRCRDDELSMKCVVFVYSFVPLLTCRSRDIGGESRCRVGSSSIEFPEKLVWHILKSQTG